MLLIKKRVKQAIPVRWEKLIFDFSNINENVLYQIHHVIKGVRTLSLENYPRRKYIQF